MFSTVKKRQNTQDKQKSVVLANSAHGGFDGGAVVGDVLEKDINLKISNSLSNMLRASGFRVICTRTSDSSTESDPTATIAARKRSDLNNRLEILKQNPDAVFISIHLNKFSSPSAKGAQMFYAPKDEKALKLAECLKTSVKDLLQPENHRTVKAGTKSTFLLYYSPIPAVIAECGFMSNGNEFALLQSEKYQHEMAFSLLCGILKYFNT